MNPIRSSLRHPQVTLSVLFIVFAAGIWALLTMPRREDPKIAVSESLIVAMYPGADATQVEDQVTRKLEKYLFQFAEVNKAKTNSTTRDGMVVVDVQLNGWVKNTDVFWSKLRHEMAVAKALDLPDGVLGPVVDSDFGDTEALLIALESDSCDYTQLKTYAMRIEEALRTLPATSKVRRIGEQGEEIQIHSSSERMAQYGISVPQVAQLLRSQNAIGGSGTVKTKESEVPLHAQGIYKTETDLAAQVVGNSRTGEAVRLGQVADLKRVWKDPTSTITVNGHRSLLLAVQMQEGNNIVEFGKQVDAKLAQASSRLPSKVKVHKIVDQPHVVDVSVGHFLREFLLAILAVVVVTIILLPLHIAAVAAMAIPMTVAATFAILQMVGIELHQVSLAALIVALGMVVDDAIVIADNYVELLDHGVPRGEAAWRSAGDLWVPVLTATATIIAAFLPILVVDGDVGDFIRALPLTASIALAVSFVVALFFTPILCHSFIRKGLHGDTNSAKGKPSVSMLDRMQSLYDWTIDRCVAWPKTVILLALLSVVAGVVLFQAIPQKFFPAAERNQFVVELWMPTGTRLEKTQEALARVETRLKTDRRVQDFATFAGTSAPRFYYNFSPEFPVPEYGLILINTIDEKTTEELSRELTRIVDTLIPEGTPQVRLMQQGTAAVAPVEVRVFGEDLATLRGIGDQIEAILRATPGTVAVKSNFHEDILTMGIRLKDDAQRLGFTTESVSKAVYMGFSGAPASTLWEGDEAVDITLKLSQENRRDFQDLSNLYLLSPIANQAVPLRQIADLVPQWKSGRIIHRNGQRCYALQSDAKETTLPSKILESIQPKIAKIALPNGYRIDYGGEEEGSSETFAQLLTALSISMLLIFLVILFQFRDVREVLIVMSSIPLSLFGAMLGLWITGNNFGMTSFVGLISLTGIVVRNAIMLLDYSKERMRLGDDVRTAAIEAGKRRLRPIFLTAMAAAIGVLPMILSGSSLWSPLASVIAVGVVFSMVMTLLVVPVLCILWMPHPATKPAEVLP